jgi:excisionase family DNA binding protein
MENLKTVILKRKESCNQRPEPQKERNHPEKIIYLTSHDLAQRFRVTQREICKLARIGYLPAIRLGKLWRFREDVIEGWERKQIPTNDIERLANEILNGG